MAQPLLSHSLAESVPSAASARQAGAEEKLRLAERVLQQAELRAGLRNQQQWGSSEVFSVPEALAKLDVRLPLGATVAVRGSTSLLLTLLSAASTKSWIAVVGMPNLGLVAADEYGLDLSRVMVVPRPKEQAASVLAAVIDGFDLVVVGEGARLRPAQRRSLVARARERRSTLFVAGWPEALVQLEASVSGWVGIGRGEGYLRERQMQVRRHGRDPRQETWVRLCPGWLNAQSDQELKLPQQEELTMLNVSSEGARRAS